LRRGAEPSEQAVELAALSGLVPASAFTAAIHLS
jgi:hypothetical protein